MQPAASTGLEVLLVGYSNIVARRVIPALSALGCVSRIHLASRRALSPELMPPGKRGQVFRGYDAGLHELEPGLAYISLPNSLHAEWAQRALQAGFHVIIDKPACVTLAEAEELAALSARQDRCVAEAIVWNYHPQFRMITELLATRKARVTRIAATLSFPPMPKENFRNNPELGGGAILDLGPYAASCGRYFFGEPPKEITARVLRRDPATGLPLAFSLLAIYSEGRALSGHFGFDTEYQNTVSLLGHGICMQIERAFTTTPDYANQISWRSQNIGDILHCPPGDSFALFLQAVIAAVLQRQWAQFPAALLQDATFRHQLRDPSD